MTDYSYRINNKNTQKYIKIFLGLCLLYQLPNSAYAGCTISKTITIQNLTDAPLTLESATAQYSQFTQSYSDVSIPAGAATTLNTTNNVCNAASSLTFNINGFCPADTKNNTLRLFYCGFIWVQNSDGTVSLQGTGASGNCTIGYAGDGTTIILKTPLTSDAIKKACA